MFDFDFWQNEQGKLRAIILPFLSTLAQIGAIAAAGRLRQQGVTVDPTTGNIAAAAWARQYTDQLLNQLGTTNEKVVGEIVANWIETPGATRQDLVDQLKPVLAGNEYRADLIGETETTRAYAEGNAIVYQQAGLGRVIFKPPGHPNCRCWDAPKRLKGGVMVVTWQTNRDEVVCRQPIQTPWGVVDGCGALHNVCISEGEYLGQKV